MQSSDIAVAAIKEPDENEARDMDFFSVFEPCVLRVSRSARPSGVYKVSRIFE